MTLSAKREWQAFRLALGLLTRIPVSGEGATDKNLRSQSLRWYPLVGFIIGLPLLALALALPTPALLTAALILCFWVAITGALHLDGLADSADAWVGGMGDPEKTLRIMKDPASGPIGVTTVVLCLLVKFAAIAALLPLTQESGWWLAPVFVRAMAALAFITTDYVRAKGMGEGLSESTPGTLTMALSLTLTASLFFMPLAIWITWLAVAAALFLLWRKTLINRLGGFTGDCVGALIELLETALLVATAVLIGVLVI